MSQIITTSELQRNIGRISREIGKDHMTVVNRGEPKMILLPYFPHNDDFIQDYMEQYEIRMNRDKLSEEIAMSHDS